MLEVTKEAAQQIRKTANQSDMDELALRIAASRKPDGSIDYKMGFDEIAPDDVLINSRGVDVVIANRDKELINGLVLDFVELEPGNRQFIFMNPNDPHHVPPSDST